MERTALKALPKVETPAYEPTLGDQIHEAQAILSALEELAGYLVSEEYPNARPYKETPFGLSLIFSDLNDRLTKILKTMEKEA